MASVNEVRIMGNLGADPDLRYTKSGVAVASANLAMTKKWTDKETKQEHEHTEWIRVVVWGKAAEAFANAKKKGDQIYVAGHLRTTEWTDERFVDAEAKPVKHYTTEIHAGNWDHGGVKFTGKAPASGRAPHPAERGDPSFSGGSSKPPPSDNYVPASPGDDDIPF